MAGKNKQLNDRQLRFVDEYVVNLNATQSAKLAGYSEKTAYSMGQQLLKNIEVARAIAAKQVEMQKRTNIDADFVIAGIVDTIERCKQAVAVTDRRGEPIMVETPDGSLAPAYKFDASNVLKGYELLGKHLGIFTDKLELKGKMDVNTLSSLIDELSDDN